MMKLLTVVDGISYSIPNPIDLSQLRVSDLRIDSRQISRDAMFVAVRGLTSDGHDFISEAIKRGASVVVCEELPPQWVKWEDVVFMQVADTRQTLGELCRNFFEAPDNELCLVGITGTNGKTSIAHFFYQMIQGLGVGCGLISTIENRIGLRSLKSTHTTPDIVSTFRLLREMADAGCEYAVMEVSSHALDQGRVDELEFNYAVFTNITHDHLDYHGDFQSYLNAKKKLFDALPANACAIVNADDRHSSYILQNCKAKKRTFALSGMADYRTKLLGVGLTYISMMVEGSELIVPVGGHFNAWNVLAVMSILYEEQIEESKILLKASQLKPVPGRMEYIRKEGAGATILVDYAHTPDALENALRTIRKSVPKSAGLCCVIGCGGDRDKEKRPIMGKIAVLHSDLAIFTSDNPRSEGASQIIQEMKNGLPVEMQHNLMCNTDREEAIKMAIRLSNVGDVILIAGKGHEKYQEIDGKKYDFDDVEVATRLLRG